MRGRFGRPGGEIGLSNGSGPPRGCEVTNLGFCQPGAGPLGGRLPRPGGLESTRPRGRFHDPGGVTRRGFFVGGRFSGPGGEIGPLPGNGGVGPPVPGRGSSGGSMLIRGAIPPPPYPPTSIGGGANAMPADPPCGAPLYPPCGASPRPAIICINRCNACNDSAESISGCPPRDCSSAFGAMPPTFTRGNRRLNRRTACCKRCCSCPAGSPRAPTLGLNVTPKFAMC